MICKFEITVPLTFPEHSHQDSVPELYEMSQNLFPETDAELFLCQDEMCIAQAILSLAGDTKWCLLCASGEDDKGA